MAQVDWETGFWDECRDEFGFKGYSVIGYVEILILVV